MKRQFTLLLLALIPAVLFVQPVITNAENFSIGTVLIFQQCNSSGVNAGNAGAGQTWDFSALTSSGSTSVETMVKPSSTTHGSLFPTSDLAEKYSNGTFVYVNKTADSSELVGYVDTTSNSIIQYPNSFNNVLRLKITQSETDTTVPSGIISNTATISYVWFDGVPTSGLLKIDSTHSGASTSKSVEYLLNESTAGISEITGHKSFNFYPDPAKNFILIESENAGELFLTNITGQIVFHKSIKDKQTFISTDFFFK